MAALDSIFREFAKWMSSDDLASAAVQLLPIWFFGAIVGLLVRAAFGAVQCFLGTHHPSLTTPLCCSSSQGPSGCLARRPLPCPSPSYLRPSWGFMQPSSSGGQAIATMQSGRKQMHAPASARAT